jgi:hypothetical protein
MPLINVEGVGLINFDDSMSREQITQAIERDILPQIRNSRQVSDEPMGPAVPQRAPQPTAESLNRSFLERNILDVGERGYQNLMLGIGALRARSPDSFYGLSPEDAAKDIAARLRRLQEIPRTEASQRAFEEAAKTESVAGAAGRLAQSSSALGDIAGESFGANPLAAPVGILANVTPVPVLRQLIGALAGALNFPTEFATSMGDSLLKAAQDQGVDPGKPEELAQLIRAVNDNPELKQKMRDDALTRASIISSVDALAGYGAGRLVTRGAVGRIGGGAAVEGGGGGVGEAAAQLATEGKIDPVEVAAEILGGGAMGAAGNIRRSPIPPERGENEELRSAIGDIVANRPAEPEAPLALPRERATVDFPGGMLTRTQAENYLVSLEERFPELRFVGGGTEDARGDFDTRLRYAQVKLQDEQERVQQGFQQQQEALIRNELAFSPETEEAFRLAELQRQTGIRPDEEALGPVAEIRSAERRLARFEEDFADTRRELSTAQNRRVVDAVEVEGLRDSLADLRQKIAEEQRNIADLRSEIPESQRGITQRENLNLSAQEAFDVAQQRAGRAGPSVTDLRAGAPEVGRPRMVLNPQFDKNNRLVGGEGIIAITRVTPEGTVFATVNREVNGVVQEVPVEVNPDDIYAFPMRETARSTQESIAARVGPEQVAGKRGAGVDPRGQSLTPRRVTDRTSQIPETQEEFRPDWRLGEQVGAAPEMPATAPLPQNVKELLAAMRRGKAQPKGQVSLVQQIIKGGGLRDTGGEILQFLGGKATNRPGLINRAKRTIVMKGGKPTWKGGFELDQAAEYLAGAKYFTDIPTDDQLLNAIDEELSGRAVNYGPTEDIRGQELSEAARQLDREMSIAGVSLQDSDEDIARALGFEAEAQPRTLEDIEREDEARRIAFSARSVGEKADTEAQAEAKAEQEPPNIEKAQAIVKKFLDDLRAKGKTGRLLANALEAALKNKKFNANQIYEAFMIHEALLKTMPKGANYQFRFLEDIVITEAQAEAARASGAKVGDRAQGLIEPPTESLPGFVNISLAEDMLPILRETGAHEAFHVLQDYFAAYDQSFAKQIDKHFKDDMTIDELEPSIKRRLQIMKPPGSNVTYWQSLKSDVGDNKISAKEAQAYAFGALLDASNRGQKIVGLTAPIQRFFNFTKDFFSALRSGFRGDGFRTPASLLTSATERAASFEQQAPKSGAASFSARAVPKEIMDDYEAFSKDLGGAPVVYADKNVALIEAVNASGEPVYVGVNYDKGRRTVFDIDGRDSNLFTKDQLDLLRKEKQSKIKRDEEAFKKNPNGPFVGSSRFASTENMPENLSGFGEGLVRLLGMNDIKVFFVSDKDTTKADDFINKYNLFGPYSRAREGFIKTGNYGTMYPSQQNKFYAIKIKSGLRPSMQMETMGHEVGHVFKEVALNTAPKETVDGILNAHAKWYQKNKGGSVRNYVSLMRPLVMGKVTVNEAASSLRDRPASELANFYSYWGSFDEWFADQVARWATTSERPQSLIDKFFARIAAAYRKIVNALSDAGIPDQTVANFIESYIDGKLTEKAPSTKMKAGDQLSLFAAKPEERFSARQAPEARLASRKPATQNAAAKNFYQSVIADADKIGLLDRVLSTLFDKKKGESVFSAIARTSVNRAAALYNADQMAAGKGYTGRSAGKAMEMALTNSGRIAQMLSHGMGKIDAVTGIISRRTDVKPLLTIMREAGVKSKEAKNELQVYLAALRERDLRKNGRKGFLDVTDAAVFDAIKDAETKHPNWKQTAAEMDKFNNALIDWAVDTGLISKRQAQNLRDVFYTPFYRVMEKDTTTEPSRSVTPRIGESFTNVASAINRELEGGERPLGNLFDNIIMNADSIMKAGLKNLAMKTAAETMEFAKLGQKNTTGTRKENTITYKVDGKDIAFDVEDSVLFSALAGMPRTMQNGIYNTMAKMASIFRDFVTASPSFILSSLYKGKISAFVQEGQSFTTNTLAGVRDALNASTSLQNFQLQTGFGGMEYGMEPRNMARVFERKLMDEGIMKALGKRKVWSAMRQGFSKMQELSEASEMAERIKLAENLINKGMKPEDAYFQAYLLAPYSRRGTGEGWLGSSVQFFMPLVPFLNAKVQTTYRLIENEKGDKRKLWTLGLPQQIFLRGLVLTGFSLMAYGLNLEEDEEKWDKIPPYMKLNYDIIPFMGNYITLPRAFEIGQVFGALPIFVLDAIRRGEGKDLAEALVEVGKNTFWMNPIPKAIDPILGAFTNYDFFRGRPLESKGEQALPVGERINRTTTKTGEALSATVNMIFGDVLSPIKAQALLDGYTGTLGVSLMAGFDSLLSAAGAIPGKPAGAFGDPASMPAILANFVGLQRFYREDASMVSRFVGDFYKIKEMTDQLVRSQNLARQAGDLDRLAELRGEEGLPLRMRSSVNAASERIADINKRIRMIERSDRDAEDKKEAIQPLIRRRDEIARRVVDQAKNLGIY